MHNLGKIGGKAAAAGLCLLAAACGVFKKDQLYACPAVFILQDAQNLTRFKPGPGRDIIDIRFEAEIFDFRGKCGFNEDDGIWAVEVELLVQISVEKGPANRQREIEFEYFVVLPAFEGKPGGKRIFTVKGQFEEGRTKLVYQDDVALNLPLKNPNDGGKTEIVFGFQLTPDELKFNRARQRR
ncbi:MAG TPA: hypothetical protein DEV64_06355 [Rhodospirillaceae bacterium]|nr:hypothetical protein [Rhodospirillaceae bacterium]|tara:strand:+ start:989 stop:1537 length:549 start_codon:yes stop_codon:yes gene_type:complete